MIEYLFLIKSIQKIPLRILVNGTRGKTTTVNIIYNILRRSNYKVFAKTTGEQPIEYYPDGQHKILKRFAPASIIENVRLLSKWAKLKPDVIVMECMALHAENQFILSKRMFKPTHVLITNILNDHLEVMGENIDAISHTISESFYKNAKILLPENIKPPFDSEFDLEYHEDVPVEFSFDNIPNAIISKSWGLIAKTSETLDVNIKIARDEFHKIWKQKNENIRIGNKELKIEFWNLFSVNDYDTSKYFIEFILDNHAGKNNVEIIFNTRSDRPLRTKSFVPLLIEHFKNHKIYSVGTGKSLAFRLLKKSDCNNIHTIKAGELISKYNHRFDKYTTMIGLGNYKGVEKLVNEFNLLKNGEVQ